MDKSLKKIAESYNNLRPFEIYKIWVNYLKSQGWSDVYPKETNSYTKDFGLNDTYTISFGDLSSDRKEIELTIDFWHELNEVNPVSKKKVTVHAKRLVIANSEPTIGFKLVDRVMNEMVKSAK